MDKIVQSILRGETKAVRELYREYEKIVRRFLQGKISNESDVEELLQDTFMSALDSLPLYRGDSTLKTWILSIARHEVADFYRKRYVRKVVEKTSPLFDEVVAEMSSPEFEMKKIKMRKKFYRAYRTLSQDYRDVLSYRYELGMSVKEVAGRMKMTLKATESLLFRARVAFRLAYENGE